MAVLGQGDQPKPVISQGDARAGDHFRESRSLPRKQAAPWKTPDLRSGVTVNLGGGTRPLLRGLWCCLQWGPGPAHLPLNPLCGSGQVMVPLPPISLAAQWVVWTGAGVENLF